MGVNMRVLIIDANEDYKNIYSRKFEKLGNIKFDFNTSLTEEILKSLCFAKPDVILVNHYHKNVNGMEIYDLLRKWGYLGKIIITTAGKANRISRFRYNGIAGILDKSAQDDDFVKEFKSLAEL